MQRYIDFHCHTIYSDGNDTPESLVRNARINGIDILAVTDHDNFYGYPKAKKAGNKWGLKVLPGVEFSTGKYHTLAIGFDPNNKKLLNTIEKSKHLQKENTKLRVEILARYGIPISMEKLERYNPNARLGKMNILFTMLKDKECRDYLKKNNPNQSPDQIRNHYFGKQGIAGSENGMKDLEAEEISQAVHNAGGIWILAHPAKDVDNIEEELEKLLKLGLDGIEVQPNYIGDYSRFIDYAQKNNLLITYGSDHHGSQNLKRPLLGRGMNILSQRLEDRLGLREYKAQSERKLCRAS
jgi:3',5'-nucleoside bisphosphate phosphatase